MNELHMVTVGVSLLSNFSRETDIPVADAKKHSDKLKAFLKKNPTAACAEINSLQLRCGILDKRKAKPDIALVVSHNAEGQCAAGIIAAFLKRECGIQVVKLQMSAPDLAARADADPDEVNRKTREALLAMRDKVQKHVEKIRKQHPNANILFNMTGGYKAEVAVLYELGRFLRVPVYYLHESYKMPVELP